MDEMDPMDKMDLTTHDGLGAGELRMKNGEWSIVRWGCGR